MAQAEATTDKPIIAALRPLPRLLRLALDDRFSLSLPPREGTPTLEETKARIAGAQALVATAFDNLDAETVSIFPPSLKLIASFGVGVDHIDMKAVAARGIIVTNTPDVTTPCLADMTMGLIIAACRRFREGLDIAKTGEGRGLLTPDSWGLRVSGKPLGIVGMGSMGQAVAQRARAFDMPILYTTPRPRPEFDEKYGAKAVDLDTLLREADIVSLHCPLKPETHHLIDAAALEKMKDTAVLINMARGPVVDELAMIDALKTGKIFAAGLDVFETEPGPIREELRVLPNVYCLPHIGSATRESRAAMGGRVLENINHFFDKGEPLDPVAPPQ